MERKRGKEKNEKEKQMLAQQFPLNLSHHFSKEWEHESSEAGAMKSILKDAGKRERHQRVWLPPEI